MTTPTARLKDVQPGQTAEVTYSVTNATPGSKRAAFSVKTRDPQQSWYSIKGDPASDLAPGATQQVVVVVGPPAGTAPQAYGFSLVASLSGQEDSDFTLGPEVTYTVAKAAPRKPFPWWIAVAAVVLLALVGGVVYLVVPKNDCRSGYVWRNAFEGDHVCVVPATRDQAADDDAHAASRVAQQTGPTPLPYGPDTCVAGYVWRDARVSPPDHVCVTLATRQQAADDNAAAASNRKT